MKTEINQFLKINQRRAHLRLKITCRLDGTVDYKWKNSYVKITQKPQVNAGRWGMVNQRTPEIKAKFESSLSSDACRVYASASTICNPTLKGGTS
jgi:hypothetical protein